MRDLQPWRDLIAKGELPDRVTKTFIPESVVADTVQGIRKATFVLSSGDEDRDGDIVEPDGWDLTHYRKNPVVLWAHDTKQPPIARSESIEVKGGKLRSVNVWPDPGVYAFADTVYGLVKGGFLNGTSVGFHPVAAEPRKTKGIHFKRQELYEHSILPIPANRQALVEAKTAGLNIDGVVDWAEEFLAYAEKSGLYIPKYRIEKAIREVMAPSISVPGLPDQEKRFGRGYGLDRRSSERRMGTTAFNKPERRKRKRRGGFKEAADEFVLKYISHEGGEYVVHAESGKVLGKHKTRAEAVDQLQAIEANKGLIDVDEILKGERERDELGRFAGGDMPGRSEKPSNFDPSGGGPSFGGHGEMFDESGARSKVNQEVADAAKRERFPGGRSTYSFDQGIRAAAADLHNHGYSAAARNMSSESHIRSVSPGSTRQHYLEGYRAFIAHFGQRPLPKRLPKAADEEVTKLAELIFGTEDDDMTLKEFPPKKKDEAAPPAGMPPDAKAGETPGTPPPGDGKMPAGSGAEALTATLMQELAPLAVPGGNPVQVAPALKAALEKFAAAFMQQFAGAPAAPPAGAPPGATPPPAAAPPPPPAKGADMFDDVVKMLAGDTTVVLDDSFFAGLTQKRVSEIVEASVAAVVADHRMKTTGRLPD